MIPIAVKAALTLPAGACPKSATWQLGGGCRRSVPLPGSLMVHGARRVGRERRQRQGLPRPVERWQAIGRRVSGSLVVELAGAPRCGPIRQAGSVVRPRQTGNGPGRRRPDLKRSKRITGSKTCGLEPARPTSPPRAIVCLGVRSALEPCGMRMVEGREHRRSCRAGGV